MRKWAIFMCSAAVGAFVAGAVRNMQEGSWGYAVGRLLIAFGFTVLAWSHLEKLKEGS